MSDSLDFLIVGAVHVRRLGKLRQQAVPALEHPHGAEQPQQRAHRHVIDVAGLEAVQGGHADARNLRNLLACQLAAQPVFAKPRTQLLDYLRR